jgi:hypothetical protein
MTAPSFKDLQPISRVMVVLVAAATAVPLSLLLGCDGSVGSAGPAPAAAGAGPGPAAPGAPTAPNGSPSAPIPDAVGVTVTEPCYTPQQSFAFELYGPVFSRCIGCHNEFGLARQAGVGYRLRYPGEPNFAEYNTEVLNAYAGLDAQAGGETLPLLLAKPTGKVEHVGGEVLPPGSPEARLLTSFVEKLRKPPACATGVADQAEVSLQSLTIAPPRETYARAKFVLTGELAAPEELDGLEDSEAMLDQKLDELLASEAFVTRAAEMFGDWLRTDAYSSLVRGDELLGMLRDYPRRNYFLRLCTADITNNCCDAAEEPCCVSGVDDPSVCTEQQNNLAIDAIAREPLELVKHIVRNGLPLTELVTANYGMINPYSATVYGFSPDQRASLFDDDAGNDATEFRPIPLAPMADNALRESPDGAYPYAGVLTMPSTLVRYPSSTSNQQRTRGARVILERMLAIPVMKLADFSTATLPADADLELATQEYAACTVCHSAIDPIAAHFRNFGSSGDYRPGGQARQGGRQPQTSHLPAATFLDQVMPAGSTDDPARWLGKQVAQQGRFALGVLLPVLADLIGAEILTPPTDVLDGNYAAKYLAWRIQQIEIQRLRREFAGPAALRLKPLIKAIVKGTFFRASGASNLDALSIGALALAGVGPGTLLTPEQMARKLESATGLTYRSGRSATGRDMFRSFQDYRLMFGGTDWDATPERYRDPNAMSVRIALRMSSEVACVAVPQDLARIDRASRRLFRNVDASTTPEGGGEAAIRSEIRRLHRLLLNEDLPEGDPELEATYGLWLGSYQSVSSASGSGRGNTGGSRTSRCQATASYTADATPYPTDTHQVVNADPSVRAWVAVLSYLLADGRFFLQ